MGAGSVAVVAAGALVLCVGATACGGQSRAAQLEAAATRVDCLLTAENHARARVVSRFYARGELGDAQRIRREALSLRQPGMHPTSFLDPSGAFIPYVRMTDAQKDTFLTWEKTARVQRVVRERERAAIARAVAAVSSKCG